MTMTRLRQQRWRAKLTLAEVARCFPRSLSGERVRQIETKRKPSPADVRDFAYALSAAMKERERKESILTKILAQF